MDRNNRTGPVSSLAKDGQAQQPAQVQPVNAMPFDPGRQLGANIANIQSFIIGINMSPGAIAKATNPFIHRNQEDDAEDVDPETGELKSDTQAVKGAFSHYKVVENPFRDNLDYKF